MEIWLKKGILIFGNIKIKRYDNASYEQYIGIYVKKETGESRKVFRLIINGEGDYSISYYVDEGGLYTIEIIASILTEYCTDLYYEER